VNWFELFCGILTVRCLLVPGFPSDMFGDMFGGLFGGSPFGGSPFGGSPFGGLFGGGMRRHGAPRKKKVQDTAQPLK